MRSTHLFVSSILAMSSSNSFAWLSSKKQSVETAVALLDSVYGPINHENFPLPMPASEAGLCADGYQRRYLWTDAFGVLAYTSLADFYENEKNDDDDDGMDHNNKSKMYRQAADRLIATVHQTLGRPRSNHPDDEMKVDATSPTGFVGLRIGKVLSRKVTDYGMQYDGMYWHYMDKWLFALARAPGHAEQGIRLAKSVFGHFFDAGPKQDGHGGGMRWKLSVDATPPAALKHVRGANDDTLVALIVFELLQHAVQEQDTSGTSLSLVNEIALLRNALQSYQPRVTDDPLGWGLEAIFDQYLIGQPRSQALASLASSALNPYHLSLPFRLYGALIGARTAGASVASPNAVDRLVNLSLEHEAQAQARGETEHSSINRVMLAMCLLCPGGALTRKFEDPLIRI